MTLVILENNRYSTYSNNKSVPKMPQKDLTQLVECLPGIARPWALSPTPHEAGMVTPVYSAPVKAGG